MLVILLAAANVINIGADIGALGAASALIIHIPVAVLMIWHESGRHVTPGELSCP